MNPNPVERGVLRRLAEAATPGEWHAHYNTHGDPSVITRPGAPSFSVVAIVESWPEDYGRANNEYIAAADPPTVLGLLDQIDTLTAENATLHHDFRYWNDKANHAIAERDEARAALAANETIAQKIVSLERDQEAALVDTAEARAERAEQEAAAVGPTRARDLLAQIEAIRAERDAAAQAVERVKADIRESVEAAFRTILDDRVELEVSYSRIEYMRDVVRNLVDAALSPPTTEDGELRGLHDSYCDEPKCAGPCNCRLSTKDGAR